MAKKPPAPALEVPFVAEVLAHPDDDAPRLVFADWLMDRKDPRGELISIQCLHAGDDDSIDRVAALLDAHAHRWLEGLGPKSLSFTFHRGFVEEVRGPAEVLARHVPKIAAAVPLRRVVVEHLREASSAALVDALVAARVRSLWIADTCNDTFERRFLASTLPEQLEELEIWWDGGVLLARAMPRLRSLRVQASQAVFRLEAPVEQLVLEASQSSTALARELPKSPMASTLRHVTLSRTSLPVLAGMTMPNLRSIDVEQLEPVKPKDTASFAHATVPLRSLGARGAVRPELLAKLLASRSMATIEALDLSWCGLGNAEMHALSSATVPRLHSLVLRTATGGDILDADDVTVLARAPFASRLRHLDLDGNQVEDAGAGALAGAPLGELRSLHLRETEIGVGGAAALADSTSLSNLRDLDLSENQIGEEGALALANATGLKKLTKLQLHFVRVGPKAGRALKARFGGALERTLSG